MSEIPTAPHLQIRYSAENYDNTTESHSDVEPSGLTSPKSTTATPLPPTNNPTNTEPGFNSTTAPPDQINNASSGAEGAPVGGAKPTPAYSTTTLSQSPASNIDLATLGTKNVEALSQKDTTIHSDADSRVRDTTSISVDSTTVLSQPRASNNDYATLGANSAEISSEKNISSPSDAKDLQVKGTESSPGAKPIDAVSTGHTTAIPLPPAGNTDGTTPDADKPEVLPKQGTTIHSDADSRVRNTASIPVDSTTTPDANNAKISSEQNSSSPSDAKDSQVKGTESSPGAKPVDAVSTGHTTAIPLPPAGNTDGATPDADKPEVPPEQGTTIPNRAKGSQIGGSAKNAGISSEQSISSSSNAEDSQVKGAESSLEAKPSSPTRAKFIPSISQLTTSVGDRWGRFDRSWKHSWDKNSAASDSKRSRSRPTTDEQSLTERTWPEPRYSPSRMREQVLNELKGDASVSDVDQIVSTVIRYTSSAGPRLDTYAIRFDLTGAVGNVKGTLMLRSPTIGDQSLSELPKNRFLGRRQLYRAFPRAGERPYFPNFLNEFVDAEPACFYVMKPETANMLVEQNGIQPQDGKCERISLDQIVILAYTISSRILARSTAENMGQRFLEAMWEGVQKLDRSGQGAGSMDSTSPNEDLEGGFGENLMRFRFDVFRIQKQKEEKKRQEKASMANKNKQLEDDLKELEESIKAARQELRSTGS